MRLVTLDNLKEGDIIANDVMLEDYTVVLGKGTVIKESYVEKLRELEIYTVYIEDAVPEKAEQAVKKPVEVKPQPAAKETKPQQSEPEKKRASNSRRRNHHFA